MALNFLFPRQVPPAHLVTSSWSGLFPTDIRMGIREFSTDRATTKSWELPTDSMMAYMHFPVQSSVMSFPDQQSVGKSDYCQQPAVGNAVLWCSESSLTPSATRTATSTRRIWSGSQGRCSVPTTEVYSEALCNRSCYTIEGYWVYQSQAKTFGRCARNGSSAHNTSIMP